jgi:hypothetical protein
MKKLFVFAVAMMVAFAFALPATAQDKADWAWYGQARMWTAWEQASEETSLNPALSNGSDARGWNAGGIVQDDDELNWTLQTNARIGASVKWGNIGGRAEWGNTNVPQGGDFATTWRLLYGTWNFGPGVLTVGKDYTPYFFLVSGLCGPGGGECNGIGFGSIYGGRKSQLKLTMGGLQVALVEPQSATTAIDSANTFVTPVGPGLPLGAFSVANFAVDDTDQTIPKIEASYTFNLGPVGLFFGGSYNTIDQEYTDPITGAGARDFSIDSWALGIGARSAFGPFYANATAQYAQNLGNLGVPTSIFVSRMAIDETTFAEEDASYMAAQLVLGFRLSDALSFEGGVVWQNGELDNPSIAGQTIENTTMVYYLQMVWSPAKNVFIVPEIGMIDNGDFEVPGEKLGLGDVSWLGIKWQINF